MSAHRQVTGAAPGFGESVSHSHRRTDRRFDPNTQREERFVPSLGRAVTLTVSARGTKTVDERGVEPVVAELRTRGEKL